MEVWILKWIQDGSRGDLGWICGGPGVDLEYIWVDLGWIWVDLGWIWVDLAWIWVDVRIS